MKNEHTETETEATGWIGAVSAGVHARELLNRVTLRRKVVSETFARVAPELAPDFEFFRYARLDENALSAIFAEMLRPEGSHGQGQTFLRLFLETVGLDTLSPPPAVDVETESQANGQRRIDIVVRADKFVIVIENKPWAWDQDDQLRDYAAFVRSLPGVGENWWMVYLSNREPEERSLRAHERKVMVEDGHLVEVDFRQVAAWVEACAKETRALRVRVFLEELGKFVRHDINGELQLNEDEEVKKVALASSESIESTMALTRAMSGVRIELLRQLRDGIHEQIKRSEQGVQLVWETAALESFKRGAGFGFKLHDDQDIQLRFQFERSGLNGFSWGFRRDDESTMSDPTRWENISRTMSRHAGGGKASPWWPWYSDVPDSRFDASYRDWEWSPKPWVDIHSGLLARRLVACAVEVYSVFDIALLRPGWGRMVIG
ncbi:MAG: PD-(D/E)XK nuclease family protein [Proteobacteria bacterium]|nr:PD-(D/E)XK nuclease family protein [Pseudomonadota bacterium]